MFLTFSLLRKGTRRTAAGTHPPHFLFETSKRKPSRGASLAPSGQFTFCAAAGGRENRRSGKTPPPGLICRNTGVVRIGPAGVDGPVDPALCSGNRNTLSPHRPCGGGTWVLVDLVCFSFRCRWPSARREPERRTDPPSTPTVKWSGRVRGNDISRWNPCPAAACCQLPSNAW